MAQLNKTTRSYRRRSKSRRPECDAVEIGEESVYVLLVGGIRPGESSTQHPGPTIECVDFESGVVGERCEAGGFAHIYGLEQRVALERRFGLVNIRPIGNPPIPT